jgi:hypothetical protein
MYRKQVSIDAEPCVLEILDTGMFYSCLCSFNLFLGLIVCFILAGQEEYSAMRDQYVCDLSTDSLDMPLTFLLFPFS